MANIFTSLLRELRWFEDERKGDSEEQAGDDRADVATVRQPKPYVPKAKPDHWLPS